MTAVTFKGEQSNGCLALRDGSNAEELRRTSHFKAGSFPFHCSLLFTVLDTAPSAPSVVPVSQLKILTVMGSHS